MIRTREITRPRQNENIEIVEDPSNENIEIVEDPSNSNYNTTRIVPNSTTTPQRVKHKIQPTQCRPSSIPSRSTKTRIQIRPFFVADISFSTDISLLTTARIISGHTLQYDKNETIDNLVVDLQTSSLALLLNPDTKE
mmetsp:Transcript_12615/g.13823  ORF Transcript_12615/g.13823 Transcript_12615/m.13823 type:complete len:138 (+) Transcript_12615:535-948(+)